MDAKVFDAMTATVGEAYARALRAADAYAAGVAAANELAARTAVDADGRVRPRD